MGSERGSSRPTSRTKARRRALDILFESELRHLAPTATLAERVAAGEPPINPYTVVLVEGVVARQDVIDAVIAETSVGWSLARMPAVDRNILRIGVFEIVHNDDVPDEVAVSEAVGLARELSTDDSPSFVNGVLGAVAREHAQEVG